MTIPALLFYGKPLPYFRSFVRAAILAMPDELEYGMLLYFMRFEISFFVSVNYFFDCRFKLNEHVPLRLLDVSPKRDRWMALNQIDYCG